MIYFVLLSVLLLPISIMGSRVLDLYGNSSITIFALFAILYCVILFLLKSTEWSKGIYVFFLFVISSSVLSVLLFRSMGIIGNDINCEYALYKQFVATGIWTMDSHSEYRLLSHCPFISVYPGVIQGWLGTVGTDFEALIYKGIFVVQAIFTPFFVFLTARRWVGNELAFVSALFIISQIAFFSTASAPRHSMALLLFSIAIYLMFCCNGRIVSYFVLPAVLSAMVFTHYTSTYVAIFVFCLAIIIRFVIESIQSRRVKFPSVRTFVPVAIMIVVAIVWLQVINTGILSSEVPAIASAGSGLAETAYESVNIDNIIKYIEDEKLYNSIIPMLFGINMPLGISWINLIFHWLLFIAIGIGVIIGYGRVPAQYWLLGVACSVVLLLTLVVPKLTVWYSPLALFPQTMVVLSVFVPITMVSLSRYVRIAPVVLCLILLVPLYLYNSGALYEALGLPSNMLYFVR